MKVLLINGSSRQKGNTGLGLEIIAKILMEAGVEAEIVWLGNGAINDCIACGGCVGKGKCVFDNDVVNQIIAKAEQSDGFIFASPVYFAHPSARLLTVLDRCFYAGANAFRHKPCGVLAVARRAGTTASVDVLNKYPTFAEMPIVSSTYWNIAHGGAPGDIQKDDEGIQTIQNMANNMVWLLKSIQIARENGINPPENSRKNRTNFIR